MRRGTEGWARIEGKGRGWSGGSTRELGFLIDFRQGYGCKKGVCVGAKEGWGSIRSTIS